LHSKHSGRTDSSITKINTSKYYIFHYYNVVGKPGIVGRLKIPKKAKRSYDAKHSEYYWLLETKVDLSDSSDIHAKKVIQVT